MKKNKKIFDKKILMAAILCVGFCANAANSDIITTNDKYIKIINEDSFQNITNQQNLLNYGSKWGESPHNFSG